MSTRSERKKAIVQEVKAYKAARRQRKADIAALPADQQAAARQADREAAKAARAARKAEIRQLPKGEKRAAKKHDKIFRKVKARPHRAVVWGAVLCLLVFVVASVAPMVGSMAKLFSISLDSETPAGAEARVHSAVVARQVSDEGMVLLQNDGNVLPLRDGTVNVFGVASFNIRYGGGGSGGSSSADVVDLYTALDEAGVAYNRQLHDFYVEQGAVPKKQSSTGLMQILSSMLFGSDNDEPEISYLTDAVISQAQGYSPNAMLFLSSSAVETSDLTPESLTPSANSLALLDKVCASFDNVVVVINAGNAMQLGFLEDYPQVKAAVWMGTAGPYGCQSLAGILTGAINPSGRLVDTYAYDVTSAPAGVNLGDYPYTNIDNMAFLNYEEGIYVGYRYYETRYQGDEAGYQSAVQFPFGYGLSYTTFAWETETYAHDGEWINLEVKVTNTGDVPGKDVVQVYFSPPYTPGGIEKSTVELAGYAKTGLLGPGQSETVTIEFPVRDMASYDMKTEQAFVLEAGTYEIRVSKNAHEAVDVQTCEVASPRVYRTDDTTGTEVANRFSYADGGLTYLSRNDWAGTYPDMADTSFAAPDAVVAEFAATPPKGEGELPTMGADNGLMLADMKGLAYDDPKWEAFLDQFTLEEMKELFVNGAYHTEPIERLGVPQTVLLDGPAGINSFFSPVTAAAYPTEVLISSTWNDELAWAVGDAVGAEANAYGLTGWYAPAMNVHRTAMGGRNFEYFSEDPLLSGRMAAGMVKGAEGHDVVTFIKHFALNEQEINARKGVSVWANEQALREIYLRPFEIAVKEGNPSGAMSSFIYMGPKWCGGNPDLLQGLLRGEWGFDGLVSTDAVLGSFMDENFAVRYGNELMLDPFPNGNLKYFDKLYKEDPVGIATSVRDRVHTICYVLANDTGLFG